MFLSAPGHEEQLEQFLLLSEQEREHLAKITSDPVMISIMAQHGSLRVKYILAKTERPAMTEVWRHLISEADPRIRRALSQRKELSADAIDGMLCDTDQIVRRNLVEKANHSQLQILATDSDPEVAMAAQKIMRARGGSHPSNAQGNSASTHSFKIQDDLEIRIHVETLELIAKELGHR